MDTKQPEALTLATELRAGKWTPNILQNESALRGRAAGELLILHAENESLRTSFDTLRTGYNAARLEIASLHAQLEAVGAGGASTPASSAPAEPVARVTVSDDDLDMGFSESFISGEIRLPNGTHDLFTATQAQKMLATAPSGPTRKPLTAVQVQKLVIEVCDSIYPQDDASYSKTDSIFYCAFAHALEAAHGIK